MTNNSRKRWLLYGALGSILLGSGVSLAIEASHWKHDGDDLWLWAGAGTIGIALMVAGICVLIRTGQIENNS